MATTMNEMILKNNNGFMVVDTLQDALKVSEIIAKSSFCPKALAGKPGDVLISLQYGAELGLKPMQAVQNIAVINGKPAIYGDAMLAVCQQSPNWDWMTEEYLEDINGYKCTVKRKGAPEHSAIFTEADAKQAGLWGGSDPWRKYGKRMLQMRARGFALRDTFADCLKGIISAEEAQDYPVEKTVQKPRGTVFEAIAQKPIEAEPAQPVNNKETISEAELLILVDKMKQAGSDAGDVCKHLKIASLHFVPKHKLPKMLQKLDAKIASLNQEEVPHGTDEPVEMSEDVAEFFEGAE